MIFRMYDTDGSGTLDKDEFRELLRAMAAGDGHVMKIMGDLQYNGKDVTLESLKSPEVSPKPVTIQLNSNFFYPTDLFDRNAKVRALFWTNKLLSRDVLSFGGSKKWARQPEHVVVASTLRSATVADRCLSKSIVGDRSSSDVDTPLESAYSTTTSWRGLLVDKTSRFHPI